MHFTGKSLGREVRTLLCAAAAFLYPLFVQGQASAGQVLVEVKDPSGASMPASGKLVRLSNSTVQEFRTDAQGLYTFEEVPNGRYRLEVSKPGFATQSLVLDVGGSPVNRTVTLPLASEAARVDVVAATPLPGTDIPLDELPVPVQTATARDLEQSGSPGSFRFAK